MIMDTEKIRSFIQPVVIQEIDGNHILRCERTDPDVIARAAHLADTVRVFQVPLMSGVSTLCIQDTIWLSQVSREQENL